MTCFNPFFQTLGSPFGLGLFEYDDDSSEEMTSDPDVTKAPQTTSPACNFIDNVLSYVSEFMEVLDKTFNPFYVPPQPPPPPTTTPTPTTTEDVTTAAPPPPQG